jgi:hypothetical protein
MITRREFVGSLAGGLLAVAARAHVCRVDCRPITMIAYASRLVPWIVAGLSLAFLNRVYRRDWASAIALGALIFIGGVIWFALRGRDAE